MIFNFRRHWHWNRTPLSNGSWEHQLPRYVWEWVWEVVCEWVCFVTTSDPWRLFQAHLPQYMQVDNAHRPLGYEYNPRKRRKT